MLEVRTDTYHYESQRLRVGNKPARHEQTNSEQDSTNCKPVPTGPPEREQKADTKDNTGNLARNDVETTEYKQCADKGRPKITSRECDGVDSSLHVRYSTFTRVERDRLNTSSGAASCYGVSELVESNNKHLL